MALLNNNYAVAPFVNGLPQLSKPASVSITITVQEKSGAYSVSTVTGASLEDLETRLSSMLRAITSAKAPVCSSQPGNLSEDVGFGSLGK